MTEISKNAHEAANKCVVNLMAEPRKPMFPMIAEAIQEALDADRASTGWQPINDAPRGGVEFQAWIQSYGWEPRARYNADSDNLEFWDEDGWSHYRHMIPTHYRLQPVGPEDY